MKFELFVALRYLKAKRKQTMVSVISAISVLGITAGVMALVVALALSTGFREDIQEQDRRGDLPRQPAAPRQHPRARLRRHSRAGSSGSPTSPAAPRPSSTRSSSPARSATREPCSRAIDPARERQISDFLLPHRRRGSRRPRQAPATASDPEAPPPPENMIIGKEMARAMGVKVGGTLKVVVPMGRLTPFGMTVSEKTFRVAAIFESGLWDYDSNWVYTGIGAARRLFSLSAGLLLRAPVQDRRPRAGPARRGRGARDCGGRDSPPTPGSS